VGFILTALLVSPLGRCAAGVVLTFWRPCNPLSLVNLRIILPPLG
jgi:hypothetical protein